MDKYRELQELFSKYIFDNADEQEKQAYKIQKQNQEEMLNLIAKVLLRYTIVDTALSLSDTDKKALRQNLNVIISTKVKNEFNNEKDLIEKILTKATKDKYYSDAFITKFSYSFKLQKLTDEQIKEVVNKTIDSELWSDRLWSNKKLLETHLKQEVEKFLQGKTNVNQIEKVIKDRFNQNAFNTHRLVQTEVAKSQSVSNDVFAKEHGVEWQLYSATLDGKTSSLCRGLDGTKYKIDDPNKRIPGVNTHPFCRSVLINLPSKDWVPKKRRDQQNNKIIDWTFYEKWKKENKIK